MTRQMTEPLHGLENSALARQYELTSADTFLTREASPFMPENPAVEFSGIQEGQADHVIGAITHDRDGNRLTNFSQSVRQTLTFVLRSSLTPKAAKKSTELFMKGILDHQSVSEWQEAARSMEIIIQNTAEADGKRAVGYPCTTIFLPRDYAREYSVVGKLTSKFDQERLSRGDDPRVHLHAISRQGAVDNICARFHLEVVEMHMKRPYFVHGDAYVGQALNELTIILERKCDFMN